MSGSANGWPRVRLGDVLARSTETVEPTVDLEYREITVRLWGKGVVERGRLLGASLSGRRFVARTGQFIVSRIDARNGAMGLVPASLDGALVSNDFPLFDIRADRLLPGYLGWMCRTASFVELCSRASEGTTNRVRLKESDFLGLEMALPPLPEQQRIVAWIDEIARQREAALLLRRNAETETKALIGARADTVFSKLIQRSDAAFSDLLLLERGKFSHRPRNDPRFFGGNHPWIQIAEIESADRFVRSWSQTLNDDGLAVSKKFPAGTVLVSIAATIGAVAILDFDCCIPDSIVGVTPRPGTNVQFVYHYLRFVREHLEKVASQSAQKNVNLQILSALRAPVASPEEQCAIVGELDALESQVALLLRSQAQTRTELEALLPAILDRAFAGAL